MKSEKGTIFLEGISRFSPGIFDTTFIDNTEIRFVIDNIDIIRLYEGLKTKVERNLNRNWEDYCNNLFKEYYEKF
jgi:hypothetical protein